MSPRVTPGALPAPRPVRARRVRLQRRLGGRRVRGRLVRRLLRPRHVHGARLRLRARLARRALRVGHVPRPDVDGGGLHVGLVQRPRRLRRGRVPVRSGVGLARLRRERPLASDGRRRRVTTPVTVVDTRQFYILGVCVYSPSSCCCRLEHGLEPQINKAKRQNTK